jgi:hypothetical protein
MAWFQDCVSNDGEDLLAALDNAGIVDVLVAMLKHESPFCVAAASGALGFIGRSRDAGDTLMEASGAVPALVCVIKKQIPAGDLEVETAVFRRSAPQFRFADGPVCVRHELRLNVKPFVPCAPRPVCPGLAHTLAMAG